MTRICLTPGATYSVAGDEFGNIHVKISVPKSRHLAKSYTQGLYGIKFTKRSAIYATTDKEKLRRYDEADAERRRIGAAFHNALEPVIADFYRAIWKDAFSGKNVDGQTMPATYDEYLKGPHK